MELSAIVKILAVFFGMLALSKVKIPLGLAVFAGGVVLNIWAGVSPTAAGYVAVQTASSADFWLLIVITALIFEFGRYLSLPENAREFVALAYRLGGKHGRTWSLMVVPAMIGLVPMPAGALFSAPLVRQSAEEESWNPGWKAAVNYWFRHMWEYWWPLYSAVIMALSIFDTNIQNFILFQIPFSAVFFFTGYMVLIRPFVARLKSGASQSKANRGYGSLKVVAPLLIVVLCAFFMPGLLSALFPDMRSLTVRLTAMLIGVTAGLIPIFIDERKKKQKKFLSATFSWKHFNILVTVAGILMFQAFLSSSGLLPVARNELHESGVPLPVVIAVLPFLAGFVTGIALGFAGTAFPLIALLAEGAQIPVAAVIALAYGFGFLGMMLSPVHLCFVVTCDYFSASPFSVYRRIAPGVVFMMIFTVAVALVYGL